jgi:PAS domain S-box-containing protein
VTLPGDLSIGEAAAIVGVQPHTLRAWERRHPALRPSRAPSNQRRYTIDDVRALIRIKDETSDRRRSTRPVAPRQASDRPVQSVWRSALDLVPVFLLLLDFQGRVVDVNAAAASLLGASHERLHGRRLTELVEPPDRHRAERIYSAPLRQRRGWALQIKRPLSPVTVAFDCWPVRENGELRLLVLVGAPPSTPSARPDGPSERPGHR